MSDSQKPVARRDNLVVQELPGEVLVYDLAVDKAHCLNGTAAFVWKSCDGQNTVGDISRLLEGAGGRAPGEDLVWLAIDQLGENNLLENKLTAKFPNQNRREVIRKIGLAAVVALPLVTSLVAPKAVQAGSACNTGAPCTCDATTTIPMDGVCASSNCSSGCTTGCQGTPGEAMGVCS